MNRYYIQSLKKALADSNLTKEGLVELVDETRFFIGVLKVKIESKNKALQTDAARELAQLKEFLQAYIQ